MFCSKMRCHVGVRRLRRGLRAHFWFALNDPRWFRPAARGAERTVVMDKSKGEPVISVKTKSKERVSAPPSHPCPRRPPEGVPTLNRAHWLPSSRAPRAAIAGLPARRRRTSSPSIRSRNSVNASARGRGSVRSARWRGGGILGKARRPVVRGASCLSIS